MKQLDIKRALSERGLSIKDLSLRLGVTYNGARLLVTNAQTLASITKIAEALGCDITDLFYDDSKDTTEVDYASLSVVCPHCGMPISLHVSVSKGTQK